MVVNKTGVCPLVRRQTARHPIPKDVMVELGPRYGKACMLCGTKESGQKLYGFLYQLNDIVVHHFCILFSSGATQRGSDCEGIWGFLANDISTELRRGSTIVCFYCKTVGATISCCSPECNKAFHLPCGMRNESMHQFYHTFKSFCREHRIMQTVDLQQLQYSACIKCVICKHEVKATPVPSALWAPCCKHNAWFHRKCIQNFALSSKSVFKCPLCNNVYKFKARMLALGIYIPPRKLLLNCENGKKKKKYSGDNLFLKKYSHDDALWKSDPNAYAVELFERHSECNAKICFCPKSQKRKFKDDNGSWAIKLCYTCGSNGSHLFCGSVKMCQERWYCAQCPTIKEEPASCSQKVVARFAEEKPTEDLKKPCYSTVLSYSSVIYKTKNDGFHTNGTGASTTSYETIILDSSDSDDDNERVYWSSISKRTYAETECID